MKTLDERRASQREASRRWVAANRQKHRDAVKRCRDKPDAKEKHKLDMRAYAAANREQERLRSAAWRKQNPERAVALNRSYYLRYSERIKERNGAYRLRNRDAYNDYSRLYKARKRAGGGRLSRGYVKTLLKMQAGLCVVCKVDLTVVGYELDHIISIVKGGRHEDANVQLLCMPCNRRKHDHDFDEFVRRYEAERGKCRADHSESIRQ